MATFQMEVDVAVRRPPTPANMMVVNTVVEVPDQSSVTAMEAQACQAAAQMVGCSWDDMVTGVRIVRAEL